MNKINKNRHLIVWFVSRAEFYSKYALVALILIPIFLCSCSANKLAMDYYLTFGRRPPVMTGVADCVLDYGSALDEGLNTPGEACEMKKSPDRNSEKEPLKPEYFDPYDPPVKEFRLSKGDVVDIRIYGIDDTLPSTSCTVAPDGRLYYGYLDGVPAAGRTVDDVAADLENGMAKYYQYPKVMLNLISSTTMNWKIFGKIQNPGVYFLSSPLSLRQAIGLAGGFVTESYEFKTYNSDLETLADLTNSFIIRNNKKLDVDFKKLIHYPEENHDIFIKPGDYIYIAAREYREVYILGNVKNSARLQYYDNMTLMQAIAMVGAWPIGGPLAADVTNCIVIRGNLDNPCVVRCDLSLIAMGEAKDFNLIPGDIIYVHNKTLRFARGLVRMAIDTFVESFATNAGSYYAENIWFFVPTGASGDSGSNSSN